MGYLASAKPNPSAPKYALMGLRLRRYSPPETNVLEAFVPFVPGPRILGAQAPGKVESTRQECSL